MPLTRRISFRVWEPTQLSANSCGTKWQDSIVCAGMLKFRGKCKQIFIGRANFKDNKILQAYT